MKAIAVIFASVISLFSTCLCADETTLWRNIATESDWSATLDRVNVVSGQYVESRSDPICLGKEPLFYHTFFSSFLCKEWQGGEWDVMPHLVLTSIGQGEGITLVQVKDTNGTKFSFRHNTHDSYTMVFNEAIEGTSNTARGEISSKTNLINASLTFDRDPREYTLYLPSGARRIYKKTGANIHQYVPTFLLHKEIKENGYVVFYEYTGPGRLYKMQTLSPTGRLYNSAIFHYRDKSNSVSIENSYGGNHHLIHYNFVHHHHVKPADRHRFNMDGYVLNEIINPFHIKEVNYYGRLDEDNPLQLTSKQFGERAATHFEYERDPKSHAHGKVKHIFSTFPDRWQKGRTHTLYYNDSYTEVRDSEGRKDTYHFDKDKRLSHIYRFSKENGNDLLETEQRFHWSVNKHDHGMVHHGMHETADGMNVLSAKELLIGENRARYLEERFHYNNRGDIVRFEQRGNFTGTGREDTLVTQREYQLTPVSDRFQTSQLKKELYPDGTFHTYQYLGSTPLLTSEFVHDSSGKILTRKFWRHSNENNVILTVEDDGNSNDIDDVSSVNVRKIHRFILSDKPGCLGLPEIIFEEFYEPTDGKIYQLSKKINHYNHFAQVIQQDVYNGNDTHVYSLYFKYDTKGNITYSKDQMGQEVHSEYNDLNLKTKEEHVQKNLLYLMEYDREGRLTRKIEQRDGKNYATSYTYDVNARKQSETDPFGHTTYYEYDSRGNVSAITGPLSFNADGSAVQPRVEMFYDHLSRVKERREGGHSEYFEYNTLGKVTLHKDRNGATTKTIYHYNQAIDYHILPDGSKLYYVYDALKRPLKKIKISSTGEEIAEEKWIYQGLLLKQAIDEEGIASHFTYDGAGRLLTKATGTSLICYTYDSLGRVASEKTYTDGTSYIETTKKYDLANQVIEIKTTASQSGNLRLIEHKKFAYDDFGHLVNTLFYVTEQKTVEETTKYDSQGRVISFSDKEGKKTETAYDDHFATPHYTPNPTNNREYALYRFWENEQEIIPKKPRSGRSAIREWYNMRRTPNYKATARHILETYYASHKLMSFRASSLETVPRGTALKKTTKLPSGKIVEELYNAWGLLCQLCKKGEDGKEVAKEEWIYDNLKRKTKQLSTIFYKGEKIGRSETTWQYDAKGNLTTLIESSHLPDPKITKMSYTFDALLEKVIKPSQVTLHYTYDPLRHLKELKSSDNSVHYRYSYDKKGRLRASKDMILKRDQKIAYDDNNNPIKEQLLPGIIIKRSYNRAAQKTGLTLPNGENILYRYEGPHLKEVAFRQYRHRCHRYDLSGGLLEEELMSGERLLYHYDTMLRRTKLTHPAFTHEITGINSDDLVTHSCQAYRGATYETTYSYDSLCQLEKETGPLGHSYGFDSHEVLRHFDETPTLSNEKHQVEKLKETHLTYDINGNRQQKAKWSYEYDALDRLIGMQKEGLKLTFTYDSHHRRLTKTLEKEGEEPLTTLYLYDGDAEIGSIVNKELQELRILKDTSFAEIGAAVLILLDNTPHLPLHDLFGNTFALLPLEDPDLPYDHTLYSAFGEELTLNKKREATIPLSPWTFQSKRKETESQLIYFGRRFYDPETCSFINPDPKELGTIPNPYTYVHNNPLLHHDLYGLEAYNDYPMAPYQKEDAWMYEARKYANIDSFSVIDQRRRDMQYDSEQVYDHMVSNSFKNLEQYYEAGYDGSVHRIFNAGNYPEGDERTIWINGIKNNHYNIDKPAMDMSRNLKQPIHVIHFQSHGLFKDVKTALNAADGIRCRASDLFEHLTQCFHEQGVKKINVKAHSAGAPILRSALPALPKDITDKMHITCIGGAVVIRHNAAKSVLNYASSGDYISKFAAPALSFNDLISRSASLIIIPSANTINLLPDHGITGNTYSELLKNGLE